MAEKGILPDKIALRHGRTESGPKKSVQVKTREERLLQVECAEETSDRTGEPKSRTVGPRFSLAQIG
jgi:hypothetical protein